MNQPFVRNRFTWLAYFMLAYYSYLQASLGPMIPFLRAELNLNYALAGLHLSAFALGMFVAGSTGDRIVQRWGRTRVFWFSGTGMAVAALLMGFAQQAVLTIGSSFLMGAIGTLMLVIIQAALSDQYGERRAVALTESNVCASIGATLAPLLVGLGNTLGPGWRSVLFIGAAVGTLAWVTARRVSIPESQQSSSPTTQSRAPLSKAFWSYWVVLFLCVSIEWCVVFWAADYLEKIVGLTKDTAATASSLVFVAAVMGRAVFSRLTWHLPSSKLLLAAMAIVAVGFPIFWLSRTPALNLAGLFICGLGVSNLFPLSLSTATTIAAAQINRASSRISMGTGLALLITPQVLGLAADQVGIQNAYAMVLPLLAAAA
ncbi:MAG TPA: MFS transporter, partial [Phototrophicaceae bacterium]|nr:MFS transporter [Phototrophicaceae bacterium]